VADENPEALVSQQMTVEIKMDQKLTQYFKETSCSEGKSSFSFFAFFYVSR